MKNTTMKLSDFRAKMNTTLLKRIGAGEETIVLTSHGFPIAQVTAIDASPPLLIVKRDGLYTAPMPPFDVSDICQRIENGDDLRHSTTNTFTTSGDATFTDLDAMLEAVKDVVMTPVEKEEQRRSFAHGNANIENPDVTREVIDEAADRLNAAEDEADVKSAREALAEPGRRPWSEVREELGLDLPSKSVSMEEAVAREETPPGYLTEDDLKAAQETKHEDTVSSEQAKKELGLDEDVVPEYPRPCDCTIEQLEKQYGDTAVVKDRAEFLYFIAKKRTLTATETEIYRQLMAQLRPPPSDDGT